VRARDQCRARIGEIANAWKSGEKALAFLRSTGGNRVLVALNFSAQAARFTVSMHCHAPSTMRDELSGAAATHSAANLGAMELDLEPYGCRILSIADARA